jgi:type IV secretory pathway VirJ component
MKHAAAVLSSLLAASTVLTVAGAAEPAAGLDDLPLVVVAPAHAGSDRMVIFVSGDGGWAELVGTVSTALAADGIGVVGLNSLKYFWSERTPEQTTRDIERIADHYAQAWQANEIVLIGYSFGADVLPVVANRLRPDLREKVVGLTLIAPSSVANFEVHVTGWLGVAHPGLPTLPEIERLRGLPMVCIYGADDEDAVCPKLPAGLARVEKLDGGHHFGGDFAAVARQVLP